MLVIVVIKLWFKVRSYFQNPSREIQDVRLEHRAGEVGSQSSERPVPSEARSLEAMNHLTDQVGDITQVFGEVGNLIRRLDNLPTLDPRIAEAVGDTSRQLVGVGNQLTGIGSVLTELVKLQRDRIAQQEETNHLLQSLVGDPSAPPQESAPSGVDIVEVDIADSPLFPLE